MGGKALLLVSVSNASRTDIFSFSCSDIIHATLQTAFKCSDHQTEADQGLLIHYLTQNTHKLCSDCVKITSATVP